MESYEEPPVAFGKQKEPLWVVRCRLLVRADRQRIAVIPWWSCTGSRSYQTLDPKIHTRLFVSSAFDLNPRSSGGDRLRWGVCS